MTKVVKVFVFALILSLVASVDQYLTWLTTENTTKAALHQFDNKPDIAQQLQCSTWNMPVTTIHIGFVFLMALTGVVLFGNDIISLFKFKKEKLS